jgi:hypothetical protein
VGWGHPEPCVDERWAEGLVPGRGTLEHPADVVGAEVKGRVVELLGDDHEDTVDLWSGAFHKDAVGRQCLDALTPQQRGAVLFGWGRQQKALFPPGEKGRRKREMIGRMKRRWKETGGNKRSGRGGKKKRAESGKEEGITRRISTHCELREERKISERGRERANGYPGTIKRASGEMPRWIEGAINELSYSPDRRRDRALCSPSRQTEGPEPILGCE